MTSGRDGGSKGRFSPNFFRRDSDGSVRVRVRFDPGEASRIEEAAGTTDLMVWVHDVLNQAARRDIARRRSEVAARLAEEFDDGQG